MKLNDKTYFILRALGEIAQLLDMIYKNTDRRHVDEEDEVQVQIDNLLEQVKEQVLDHNLRSKEG